MKIKFMSEEIKQAYLEHAHLYSGSNTYGFIKTSGSAAMDLLNCGSKIDLDNNEHIIFTGVQLELNPFSCGIVLPRSGHSINLKNTIGLIDSDYRGEIILKVLDNIIPKGRIAQLLILPCIAPIFQIVDELTPTERGNKGFGSTGV